MKKVLLSTTLLFSVLSYAQQTSFSENFEGAVLDKCVSETCPYADFPYNGWTANKGFPQAFITMNSKQNKYLKSYSLEDMTPTYFFAPELVSTEGSMTFQFNGSEGKLEVGTIVDKNDLSTFTALAEYEIVRNVNTLVKKDNPLVIPASEAKYIAFKFTPAGGHKTFGMDTITFYPKSLSTNEFTKKTELKFAIDLMTNKLIFSNENIKSVKVFNPNGNLVIDEKIANNELNIAKLTTGVYFILGENEAGQTFKTKFVKK